MTRIYVAEDTPEDALLLEAVLESVPDLSVTFYADGLKLYRAVRRNPPDVIVLDIILPLLSGLAVARLLKYHDHFKHIPLLMMSSIIDADIRERVASVGADAFLPKPYEATDLLVEVKRLLDLAKKPHESESEEPETAKALEASRALSR